MKPLCLILYDFGNHWSNYDDSDDSLSDISLLSTKKIRSYAFCLILFLFYLMNHWENPEMFRENKEPAHTTLMPYPDQKSALIDAATF